MHTFTSFARHTSRKSRTLPMGSISHGTLRTEDLFPALRAAIGRVRLSRADRAKFRALCKEWDQLPSGERWGGTAEDPVIDWTDDQHETASELYMDLLQLAESYTPAYAYLGMHDGDGSDLGVWAAVDSVQEAVLDGEIWQECDGQDDQGCYRQEYRQCADQRVAVPRGALWVSVSDHGNVTLYRSVGGGRSREIWGVV